MPEQQETPVEVELISRSVEETVALGRRLGALLQPGDVVLLFAPLGAGKTHLAKGLAAAFGVAETEVSSPTFVLINVYEADRAHQRMPIYHVDLYRIDTPDELATLGLEDALAGDGLTIVEWAERAGDWLPREHLAIRIDHLGPDERRLTLSARGPRYRRVLASLRGAPAGHEARMDAEEANGRDVVGD